MEVYQPTQSRIGVALRENQANYNRINHTHDFALSITCPQYQSRTRRGVEAQHNP